MQGDNQKIIKCFQLLKDKLTYDECSNFFKNVDVIQYEMFSYMTECYCNDIFFDLDEIQEYLTYGNYGIRKITDEDLNYANHIVTFISKFTVEELKVIREVLILDVTNNGVQIEVDLFDFLDEKIDIYERFR